MPDINIWTNCIPVVGPERAEKICQAKGLDFGMFLTPEEIRRKIDLSGESNHFVRQVEWNGERKTWLRVYKDMYDSPVSRR
ncbi:MAG: hypothetical protein ACLUOS_01215 [Odoribacter splanchnicus]